MRIAPLSLLLLALAGAASAGAGASPPYSAVNVVRLHPGPWRFPEAAGMTGLRSDPEDGTHAALRAFTLPDPTLRARAEAGVRIAPDGSRHAVVGAALRSWTVASIDAAGRLVTDCVHGSDAALQRVHGSQHPDSRTNEVKR